METRSTLSATAGSLTGTIPWLAPSKLTPPAPRIATVPRTTLVQALTSETSASLISVIAPPGFGKTTLLTQWIDREPREVAWVSIDEGDNDASVFLTYVAAALDGIEAIDPEIVRLLSSPRISAAVSVVPRIGASIAAMDRPFVVVLDDIHLLHDPGCLDALAALVEHLRAGCALAFAGRAEPGLPLPRLRSQGRLLELKAADLALTDEESRALLVGAGVDLPPEDLLTLIHRAEGWAAGLYLVGSSHQAVVTHEQAFTVGGDDLFVAEYLWTESLAQRSENEIRFLTRTSVLERVSGPLADAVLRTTGSARMLERLARANMFLMPLDRHGEWYRYHHLFGEYLRAQLGRDEPDLVGELHARAADWYVASGHPEAAVEHLHASGDRDRLAALVTALALPVYQSGRAATVARWLQWFEEGDLMERYPRVGVLGAWIHSLSGHPSRAARWLAAAESGSHVGPLPDGSPSIDPWIALLRASMCRSGVARMRLDALAAAEQMPPEGAWRGTALFLAAMANLLLGDDAAAEGKLRDSVEVTAPNLALVFGELALIRVARGEWNDAAILAGRSLQVIDERHLEDYVISAVAFVASARIALNVGQAGEAERWLARAERLRPLLSEAIPWLAVQVQTELARAHLALADVAAARTVLREAIEILRRRPDLGILAKSVEDLRRSADSLAVGSRAGATSLTSAELRLLPLLATYRTFREIGERLFISPNTVKSEAIGIYRKLGVSSRSAAVERARQLHLLEG